MTPYPFLPYLKRGAAFLIGLISLAILVQTLLPGVSLAPTPGFAQSGTRVQQLEGTIDSGEIVVYLLPSLEAGQTLYIRAQTTSGNLDPAIGLIDSTVDPNTLEQEYENALERIVSEGVDLLEAVDVVRDELLLAWDDDSGGGLTAALAYQIPADGDYRLVVTGALTLVGGYTFGNYEVLLGLDAPAVLRGDVRPSGEPFAALDVETTPPGVGVQELQGTLTPEKSATFAELADFKAGDTLYAYIEATSGDLAPVLVLSNFARKPIRTGNLDGRAPMATLEYTFPQAGQNYRLEIAACCEVGVQSSGDYRLLLGVNAPQVLTGAAEIEGRRIAQEPIEVNVGLKLEQMIEVDQPSEFFTAVVSLGMEWTDPVLAFNPESCQCDLKTYSDSTFDQFLTEAGGRFPEFSLVNQQGNRWRQNRDLVHYSDGRMIYFERFTTNFQVDFDFRQFPFDTQQFDVRVEAVYPEEFYTFRDLENFNQISSEHGEDEFVVEDFETEITSQLGRDGAPVSRYTFRFFAPRHLNYYIFQIFVPILLIIGVSWITFFLKDYGRRIEVASANLLLFIAFSFSLSTNYPRLGYLTFLDAIMAVMFVINALVVAYNVYLKRLEMNEEGARADRIDTVMDWVYPLLYLMLLLVIIWNFFIR